MCSFGSCQRRFEFLSQFRKVRNAFECFVTQVQTRLPKTKCVWPMKINVICTVCILLLRLHLCANVLSNWTITHIDIAFQRIGRYRKCHHEHPLGVYLVIDKFVHLASGTSSLYDILKQSDNYSWSYCI